MFATMFKEDIKVLSTLIANTSGELKKTCSQSYACDPYDFMETRIYSRVQKRPKDYVNIKYMSQRFFIFTEICLASVLSEPVSFPLQGRPEHKEMA